MKKINESFTCIYCGKNVSQADKTCRNHCPYCFISLHVDGKTPGDRNTTCGGIMYPIVYEIKNGQFKICFKCKQCDKLHRNKKAEDDEIKSLEGCIKEYKEVLY